MPLNRYAITTTGAAAILAATLVFTAAPSTAAKAVVAKTSQILVYRVTARALAGAFRGATPEQVAGGLREFAAPLKDQGVTGEERSRFGPKVAAVFERLLR